MASETSDRLQKLTNLLGFKKALPPPPSQVPTVEMRPVAATPAGPRRVDLTPFAPRRSAPSEPPRDVGEYAPLIYRAANTLLQSTPPSFPWFAAEVLSAVEENTVDLNGLARIVSRDALISMQVVRAANSARFVKTGRAADLREAIGRLGQREVAEIAAIASASALMKPASQDAFRFFPDLWKDVWAHSVATSLSVAPLMARQGQRSPSAFLGALLHDIGKMIALQTVAHGVRVQRLPTLTSLEGATLVELVHVEIGAKVAEQCNFPGAVVIACRDHHLSTLPTGAEAVELASIGLASTLDDVLAGVVPDDAMGMTAGRAAHVLRLDEAGFSAVVQIVRDNRKRAQAIMAFAT
jgi:putative nucleotidyltransferase with HDIG domain